MGLTHQGAKHIIGLHPGHTEQGVAQGFDQFVQRRDLHPQIIGQGGPVGFVIRVDLVAEGRPGGIKHHRHLYGIFLPSQFLQHVDHAMNRACRETIRPRERGQRMEGPEQE